MKLKNIRITMANVARTTNAKSMEVIATSVIQKRNESNTGFTNEIEGYAVDCSAYRGDTLKVKFPVTVEAKINKLKKLLYNDATVEISFTGLKLTPYAMLGKDGSLISGVSAKADDFEIIKATPIEYPELDWNEEQ